MKMVDISSDVGESFGRWKLGFDEELMEYISSANVACGFHAGDPMVMRNTVRMAVKHGVKIGTHFGFPDLIGFGRRLMALNPEEYHNYSLPSAGITGANSKPTPPGTIPTGSGYRYAPVAGCPSSRRHD